MKTNYKEIARLKGREVSERSIAKQLKISRNTVNVIAHRMLESGYSFSCFVEMTEEDIIETLRLKKPKGRNEDSIYVYPDYEKLTKELSKPGVTLQLLWEEYHDECRLSKKRGYQITQFKKYFNEHLGKSGYTDIIKHKAGEKIEVDWAGKRPNWQDPDTGEIIKGWLFVGILPFSGYGYAEVFSDMKQASWIKGHLNMFDYFGGVSRILIPDNLKVGIIKNNKEDTIVNSVYSDMADYYGTVIIPTRIKKPKDKPSVESLVGQLTTSIIAKMRNYQFFSMKEYNQQLMVELERVNRKAFQKKEGSRYQIFEEIEKSMLIPLPNRPYELCEWRKAKVATNSHISFGKSYYSVPHKYIGETVDLKITEERLEIYHKQAELCSFTLEKGQIGVYSTNPSHMPTNSNAFGEWNSTRYLNWAKQKGPFVYQVVQRQFESVKVEQQKYRTVHSILKLADKYGTNRLENACQYALEHSRCPNYKNIKAILTNKQDINWAEEKKKKNEESKFLRGAKYYE